MHVVYAFALALITTAALVLSGPLANHLAGAAVADVSARNIGFGELQQGSVFQSPETQALQEDPFGNPGFLWVDRGAALFREREAPSSTPCSACHDANDPYFAGAAARHPAVDSQSGRLVNLEGRINLCRQRHQNAASLETESEALLALTSYLASLAAGTPVTAAIDGAARPYFEDGRAAYRQRRGQLNLACHHCHEANVGEMLRGDTISQGHGNGYPAYRFEWQGVGSLHRRLRACYQGVRAEPPAAQSREHLALELYLAWRATGLPVEAPAVRR